MRDKLKDEQYFNILIAKEEKNIEMFENALNIKMKAQGEMDKGVRNGYNILIHSYLKKINLLYSGGREIILIEECYKKLLFYYSKMWDRKYGYIELIKVLSLAVLLGIDKAIFSELKEKLISEQFNDYLVNVLLKEIDPSWEYCSENFEFVELYDSLKEILENETSLKCEELKIYLKEKWYDIHKECAWYDSHKSEKNTYCGYWSFEAGAIAKILKLDDSSLKDMKYYPYDLVHYKQ